MTASADAAHTIKRFQKMSLPPERLFEAWVDPMHMQRWLFKTDTNRIDRIEVDLRVGGAFSFVETTRNGEEIEYFGEYLAIDRPRRLMFSLEAPKRFPGVSTVSFDLQPGDDGSWISFAHTGVEKELLYERWRLMFLRLHNELG